MQLFHSQCVLNYSKLVNLFGKGHSVSEQLFKWLPKSPFFLATPLLRKDLNQTGNHIQTTPRIPSFWPGVICHFWVSQFGGHRKQTRGVRLGVKVPHPTVSKQQFLYKSVIISKEEARIKKRKMLCYSPLVGGQKGTPVLGLCHFISEKNVVQAPRVFKVNSYIELSRFRANF